MKKLGLIINPVAGLGGSVGLKGSDGMVEEALARGAVPQSGNRARVALQELMSMKEDVTVYTGPGGMGEDLSRELGFRCVVSETGAARATTAEDTRMLSRQLQQEGCDLILFVGGDGTARETRRRLAEAHLLEEGDGEIRILNSAEDEKMMELSWQRLKG